MLSQYYTNTEGLQRKSSITQLSGLECEKNIKINIVFNFNKRRGIYHAEQCLTQQDFTPPLLMWFYFLRV